MKQLLILLLLLPFLGIAQSDRWTTAQLGEQATKLVPKAEYPTYPEYLKLMNKLAAKYPDRCQLERWGTLPSGREILTLRLTEDITNATGRPQVLYTATMHGDETAGYWLLLQLAEYLLAEDHTGLLREIEVYLNPLANPDGTFHRGNHTLVGATRGNANGVDLNRNYPDPDDGPHPDGYDYQPETKIFMQAARNHSFDMALNIHGGAEVFNYPWDTYRQRHPDTDWWRRISRDFASRVQTASTRSGYFQDRHNGVTNGHDWYPIAGSRQDYMNFFHRCREATLEVSNRKQFPASQLPKIWRYTRPALLGYLNEARFGAHGFVRDRVTGKPVKALVQVPGHDAHNSDIYADRNHGNFHRYLAAGDYQMLFSAPGYVPQWQSVKVRDGRKSEVNVWLEPLNSSKEEVTRKR